MSTELIARSPDLLRLRNEGYDIAVVAGHLVVRDVPYVTAGREVKRGVLVSALDIANDQAVRPGTHVVLFGGDFPCDQHGKPIEAIRHGESTQVIGDIQVRYLFSNKPAEGYPDYYAKMSRYAQIISNPAVALDPKATPMTFPVIADESAASAFRYIDTASSRAGISNLTQRLALRKVVIIGLGGTGSYVLDLVAKTPVGEIHLYDRDAFLNHNAFRSPGAASVEDLGRRLSKVAYLTEKYSAMRRGIIPHEAYVTAANVAELSGADFVFICIDRGNPKRAIFDWLKENGVPFIDVGMGVTLVDERLRGTLRTTTVTPSENDHVARRVSFVDDNGDADYDQNIQIADLNMLNAAFAVLKWKKLFGFYHDTSGEHDACFGIDGNVIWNEDKKCTSNISLF